MFTGIITHIGKIIEKTDTRLVIKTDNELLLKISKSDSISVNGICLTVISLNKNSFTINFIPETAAKSNIQYLQPGTEVNLEIPATAGSLLSGHIVQGHVDSMGKIAAISKDGNSLLFTFSMPKSLGKYIVEKGSISVNGISLTVITVSESQFSVGIIPHTWEHTMLHAAVVGDYVNLEVDTLAKYMEKLIKSK